MTTPVQKRLFTALLIMGVPGSGKTSLIATAAEYLWETHRKVLLLYSWDGGAITTLLQRRVKQGLIRYWRARTRSGDGLGVETTHLATRGYWPAEINPETGETAPTVRLVPPILQQVRISCPNGHTVYQGLPQASMTARMCPTCKRNIPAAEQKATVAVVPTPGFELVGGVAYDGLTSMCSVITEHMDLQRGAGQIGGEKSAFGGVVISGDVKFGGSNRADVGFAQTRALQWVNNTLSIPNLLMDPIFTALPMEVADEGGLPVVGPQLAGRAATDSAPAWFGNVVEMGRQKDAQGAEHYALYLRPFTDSSNRRHLLKTSASPNGVPDVLVDPLDAPWTQAHLGRVFQLLDADLANQLATEDLVGPGPAPASYGGGVAAAPASTGATPLPVVAAASPTPVPAAAQPQPVTPKPVVAPVAVTPMPVSSPAAAPTPLPPPGPKPVPAPVPTPASAPAAPVSTTGVAGPPPPPGRPPMRAPGTGQS